MSGEEKNEPAAGGKGETNADEELSEAELAALDEAPALSALLKRSLAKSEDDAPGAREDVQKDALLLASVQKKLRKRSKGKFYSDGWSTTQSRINYTLVALVMLVTIIAVYLVLGPTGFSLR